MWYFGTVVQAEVKRTSQAILKCMAEAKAQPHAVATLKRSLEHVGILCATNEEFFK